MIGFHTNEVYQSMPPGIKFPPKPFPFYHASGALHGRHSLNPYPLSPSLSLLRRDGMRLPHKCSTSSLPREGAEIMINSHITSHSLAKYVYITFIHRPIHWLYPLTLAGSQGACEYLQRPKCLHILNFSILCHIATEFFSVFCWET